MRAIIGSSLLCFSLTAAPVQAQSMLIEDVPAGWRLQDYKNSEINIYFSGSTCASGQLTLPASAPEESKNRLWAMVMTAKVVRQPVGVYYHVNGPQCFIDSFYLK
jgi:hypothetical protein